MEKSKPTHTINNNLSLPNCIAKDAPMLFQKTRKANFTRSFVGECIKPNKGQIEKYYKTIKENEIRAGYGMKTISLMETDFRHIRPTSRKDLIRELFVKRQISLKKPIDAICTGIITDANGKIPMVRRKRRPIGAVLTVPRGDGSVDRDPPSPTMSSCYSQDTEDRNVGLNRENLVKLIKMGKGKKVMCRTISFAKRQSLQNPITAKNMNALKKGVAKIGMFTRLNFCAKNPSSQRPASKTSINNYVTKSDSKIAQISKVPSQTSLGHAINTNLPKRKSESYLIRPFSIAQELPRPQSQRKTLPAPLGTFMTQICQQISVSKADSPNPPQFHQKKVAGSHSEASDSIKSQSQPYSATSLDGKLDPKTLCTKSQKFFATKTRISSSIAPSKRRDSNDSNLSTKQPINIDQFFLPSTQHLPPGPKSDF
jgi:hypothetical protein